MNSATCTLFEGTYHLGVAALANSLQASGFRGTLFAGHRGALPPWADAARPSPCRGWAGARSLESGGVRLLFLPLDTPHHLTNHKADFMLALLDGAAGAIDALFYLDPDICVESPWRFFEQWVQCGVALCEDVNSPLPENHPRRVGWRRHYATQGLNLRFRAPEYANGGFIGVRQEDRDFIGCWKRTIDGMADVIGSLATAKIAAGEAFRSKGFADCFDCSDQDALNAAIEASTSPISVIGQEAMAFRAGTPVLPHALGGGKPWQRGYAACALDGVPPRTADKSYWRHAAGPLRAEGSVRLRIKRLELLVAAAIGRVWRRP